MIVNLMVKTRQTTSIRFKSFPRTEPPPHFVNNLLNIFKKHEQKIGTEKLTKGLTSDQVMQIMAKDLIGQGWNVETGKKKGEIIKRPVFFGENGIPELNYQIDGYHEKWRCGLEIEAGRAWMGNAIYRDLVQALVMVQVDHLILAVPNEYKYKSNSIRISSSDYTNTTFVAEALYGHSRMKLPYGLTVIGY